METPGGNGILKKAKRRLLTPEMEELGNATSAGFLQRKSTPSNNGFERGADQRTVVKRQGVSSSNPEFSASTTLRNEPLIKQVAVLTDTVPLPEVLIGSNSADTPSQSLTRVMDNDSDLGPIINNNLSFFWVISFLDDFLNNKFRFVTEVKTIDDLDSKPISYDLESFKSRIRQIVEFLNLTVPKNMKEVYVLRELLYKINPSLFIDESDDFTELDPEVFRGVEKELYKLADQKFREQMDEYNVVVEELDRYEKIRLLDDGYLRGTELKKIFASIDFVQSLFNKPQSNFSNFNFLFEDGDVKDLVLSVLKKKSDDVMAFLRGLDSDTVPKWFDIDDSQDCLDEMAYVLCVNDCIKRGENFSMAIYRRYLSSINAKYLQKFKNVLNRRIPIVKKYKKALKYLDKFDNEEIEFGHYTVFNVIFDLYETYSDIKEYYEEIGEFDLRKQAILEEEKMKSLSKVIVFLKMPKLSEENSSEEIEDFLRRFENKQYFLTHKNTSDFYIQIDNSLRILVERGLSPEQASKRKERLISNIMGEYLGNESLISEKAGESINYVDLLLEQLTGVRDNISVLKKSRLLQNLENSKIAQTRIAHFKFNELGRNLSVSSLAEISEEFVTGYSRIKALILALLPLAKDE